MNIIQKILRHVLPLPYIEQDGIKFWTKRAYDDYLVEQELNKACANTNQQIKYYVCPGTYAHEAKAAYYKFLEFANNNKYAMIRAEMYNSGDISDDKNKVVGYGSWFMYSGSKNSFTL